LDANEQYGTAFVEPKQIDTNADGTIYRLTSTHNNTTSIRGQRSVALSVNTDFDTLSSFCTGTGAANSGGVDAFIRKPTAVPNSQYELLYSPTDLVSFLPSGITPTSLDNGDGTTTLTWTNLHTALGSNGFVILNVTNGVDTCCTAPHGWNNVVLNGTSSISQDIANNFLFNDDYVGAIVSSTGTTITSNGDANLSGLQLSGFEYYIEILDGTAEGARFEILEDSTTPNTIIIDPAGNINNTSIMIPAGITGATFALRQHRFFKDVYDFDKFNFTSGLSAVLLLIIGILLVTLLLIETICLFPLEQEIILILEHLSICILLEKFATIK